MVLTLDPVWLMSTMCHVVNRWAYSGWYRWWDYLRWSTPVHIRARYQQVYINLTCARTCAWASVSMSNGVTNRATLGLFRQSIELRFTSKVMYVEWTLGWINGVSSEMAGESVSVASGQLVYGTEPKVGSVSTMILLKVSLSCASLSWGQIRRINCFASDHHHPSNTR